MNSMAPVADKLVRNSAVDLAKYIAAILVIGIHTHPFVEINSEIDFFFSHVITRVAVPFFIVCTGFYLSNTWINEKNELSNYRNTKLFKKAWIRLVKLYLVWSFVYLIDLSINWLKDGTFLIYFVGWCKATVLHYSFYHLWYLCAMLYALVWFYFLLRFVNIRYYPIIIGLLWVLESIQYGYRSLISSDFILFKAFDYFGSLSVSFTRMLPLLLVGTLVSRLNDIKIKHLCLKTLLCFVALIVEVLILRELGVEKYSFIFCTLPLSYYLFILIFNSGKYISFDSRVVAKISLVIYCLHPLIIDIIGYDNFSANHMSLFLLTSAFSTLVSVLYVIFNQSLRK